MRKFADDHVLFYKGKDLKRFIAELSESLRLQGLLVNLNKSKIIKVSL